MENNNINNNRSNSIGVGLIILTVGVVFFLRSIGIFIPHWVINWYTFLIVIGLFIGIKRNFQGGGWLIMILVGGYFMVNDIANVDFNKFYFPVAFIILGLFLILKPKSTCKNRWNKRRFKNKAIFDTPGAPESPVFKQSNIDENDIIDSVNVFGGAHQKVYSKNFKGGDVVAIFGGCELNLSQADFEDTISIDVTAIFGGTKIIIPPTWEVKSEVVAIFGGIDDKRAVAPFGDGPRKILIIKGVALFGGVDIRNF
ncbi:MAG: LiaF domain-containing protein [Bacteroidota bacterium]